METLTLPSPIAAVVTGASAVCLQHEAASPVTTAVQAASEVTRALTLASSIELEETAP